MAGLDPDWLAMNEDVIGLLTNMYDSWLGTILALVIGFVREFVVFGFYKIGGVISTCAGTKGFWILFFLSALKIFWGLFSFIFRSLDLLFIGSFMVFTSFYSPFLSWCWPLLIFLSFSWSWLFFWLFAVYMGFVRNGLLGAVDKRGLVDTLKKLYAVHNITQFHNGFSSLRA